MKTINKVFMYGFGIIGAIALIGALFFNAPWHVFTASCCVVVFALLSSENKNEVKKLNTDSDQIGWSKTHKEIYEANERSKRIESYYRNLNKDFGRNLYPASWTGSRNNYQISVESENRQN